MYHLIWSFSFLFLSIGMSCVQPVSQGAVEVSAVVEDTLVEVPVLDFERLESLLYTSSDTTFIVNFWAMWCSPCVKELPILQEYEKDNPNVEMILVSLDFPEDIETKLKPFLKKKELPQKSYY